VRLSASAPRDGGKSGRVELNSNRVKPTGRGGRGRIGCGSCWVNRDRGGAVVPVAGAVIEGVLVLAVVALLVGAVLCLVKACAASKLADSRDDK